MATAEEEVAQAFAEYREHSERAILTVDEDSIPMFGLASAFADGVEESLRILAKRIGDLAARTPHE